MHLTAQMIDVVMPVAIPLMRFRPGELFVLQREAGEEIYMLTDFKVGDRCLVVGVSLQGKTAVVSPEQLVYGVLMRPCYVQLNLPKTLGQMPMDIRPGSPASPEDN